MFSKLIEYIRNSDLLHVREIIVVPVWIYGWKNCCNKKQIKNTDMLKARNAPLIYLYF